MRIGIDARLFTKRQYTGIARSVYEIINVWMEINHEHEYYLFSSKPIILDIDLPCNWHIIDSPWILDSAKLWNLIKLPSLIKHFEIDVYWGTNFVLPRKVTKTVYLVTIYDLALFKFKRIGAFSNTLRVKLFTKSACKKAEKVIAISKATANDIISIMGINEKKVVVSYLGGLSNDFFKDTAETIEIKNSICFNYEYFLFISTIEPRKNVITIVKAFEKFIDLTGGNHRLVLAGKRGWKCTEIFKVIEESKYKERIILPGFITDSEKAYLLKNATAFIYPSLYEGFGIPILEAFKYNLPVITTYVSSIPEVAGDAALYIYNSTNYNELTEQMIKIVDLNNHEKLELQSKMERQLKLFSWEKNAREVMNLIIEVKK